jgi:hypothetical protein
MDYGSPDKLGYKTSPALVGVYGISGEVLKSFKLRSPLPSAS